MENLPTLIAALLLVAIFIAAGRSCVTRRPDPRCGRLGERR